MECNLLAQLMSVNRLESNRSRIVSNVRNLHISFSPRDSRRDREPGNHNYNLMNEHSQKENCFAHVIRVALDSPGATTRDNRSVALHFASMQCRS